MRRAFRTMSDLTINSTVKLASGYEMPVLGYGVRSPSSAFLLYPSFVTLNFVGLLLLVQVIS